MQKGYFAQATKANTFSWIKSIQKSRALKERLPLSDRGYAALHAFFLASSKKHFRLHPARSVKAHPNRMTNFINTNNWLTQSLSRIALLDFD